MRVVSQTAVVLRIAHIPSSVKRFCNHFANTQIPFPFFVKNAEPNGLLSDAYVFPRVISESPGNTAFFSISAAFWANAPRFETLLAFSEFTCYNVFSILQKNESALRRRV